MTIDEVLEAIASRESVEHILSVDYWVDIQRDPERPNSILVKLAETLTSPQAVFRVTVEEEL